MIRPQHGVFTATPGALSNDFFVNLLAMATAWTATSDASDAFEGRDRKTGAPKWTATHVDLVVGSNTQLRALAEVYMNLIGRAAMRQNRVAPLIVGEGQSHGGGR